MTTNIHLLVSKKKSPPELPTKTTLRATLFSYKVIQPLGVGGNSVVYLVQCSRGEFKGVLFALKMFVNIEDNVRKQRFEAEIKFLKECEHPSIMQIYDTGVYVESDGDDQLGFPYVIADYLPKTLRDRMLEGMGIAEKLAFSLQLLSALNYLASRNEPITHRDIKPENIFVKGRACVLGDFGLLKEGDGIDPSVDFKIEPSSGVRFPRLYPTPDLIEYSKSKSPPSPITPKSDVFQLGLVLAELFTGNLPIAVRKNPFDPIDIVDLGKIHGSQGAAIKSHIEKMLTKDAEKRPTADEIFDVFEGAFSEIVSLSHQLEGKIF